jgi:hypothetical protein
MTQKTLTKNGTLLNREGYTIARALEVVLEGDFLRINASLHWLSDIILSADKVEAKGGAWTVIL